MEALHQLLRDCTLAISGTGIGTAIVVGPDMAVTCSHVVGEAGSLVSARDQDLTVIRVLPEVDLALLRLATPAEHCALLGPPPPIGSEVWAWGHPEGAYRSGDSLTLTYEGPSQRTAETLLKLSHGQVVEGFSGAPLVSPISGTVCGLLRLSRDISQDLGGRAIPTPVILDTFPEVLSAQMELRRTNESWLSLLDDDQLFAAGLPYAGPRLRVYLEAVRQVARKHPYGVLPGGPRLDVVYVRQAATHHDPRPTDTDSPPPPALIDAETGLLTSPGALLVAGPGMGKSSLLRRLADVLATRVLESSEATLVPVLIRARALASSHPLHMAIGSAAAEELGALDNGRPLPALLEQPPFPGARWLVLVDGLDEILDSDDRQVALSAIARWWSDSRYRFIVTSRPLSDREFTRLHEISAPRYDMEPFGHDQLVPLATRWFSTLDLPEPASLAEDVVARLRRGRLHELARAPLIASMICQAFAADPSQIAGNRLDLYERYVGLMLAKAREGLDGRIFSGLPPLLGSLAHRRQDDRMPALVSDAAEQIRVLAPADMPASVWRDTLGDLLRRTGLVSIRGNEIEFAHQTFQEYLAAIHNRDILPSRRGRRRLQYQVREQDSYALFRATALAVHGHDIYGPAPRIGRYRRVGHAGFVAQMLQEGAPCPAKLADQTTARLEAIATNESLQVDQRIWAAAALEKARPESVGADVLRAVATDPSVPANSRFWAAQRLAETAGASAADIIANLATDEKAVRSSNGHMVLGAIRRLLDIDRDRGLVALARLVEQRTHWFEAIAEIRSRDPQLAADLLDTLTRTKFTGEKDRYTRLHAAKHLAEIDHRRAADALTAMIWDDTLLGYVLGEAVKLLADTDQTYAAELVAELVARDGVASSRRVAAASALAEHTPAAAGALLVQIAGDPAVYIGDRIDCCGILAKIDPPQAVVLYAGFATDLELEWFYRSDAARGLFRAANYRTGTWEAEQHDRDAVGMLLVEAATSLADVDTAKGRDLLATLAGDDRVLLSARVEAAVRLADQGDDRAVTHLAQLAANAELDADERAGIGRSLAVLDPHLSAQILLAAATESEPAGFRLLDAAERLAEIDPHAAAEVLTARAANLNGYQFYRALAARDLGNVDRSTAIDILHKLATDRDNEPLGRRSAAEELARLDPDTGIPILTALANDKTLPKYDRWHARRFLKELETS